MSTTIGPENPSTYNLKSTRSRDYSVEGDYSSASYLIAAAASLNSDLTVQNLPNNQNRAIILILEISKRTWVSES